MSQNIHLSASRSVQMGRDARRRAPRYRPTLDALEDRVVLSSSTISLGAAGQFAVLGLRNADVLNLDAVVNGNEGVSTGGHLQNLLSSITGNVVEANNGQYLSLAGALGGSLTADSAAMSQADSAALNAASQAAALTSTQAFGTVSRPTTVTGNGGLNVIAINGNVRNSLTLSGGASDIFIVNISGNVTLLGGAALGLAGGVTPDHVLYNIAGRSVSIVSWNTQSGTLLAPNADVTLDATFNGGVIGGRSVSLLLGATVNPAPFTIPAAPSGASLSGFIAHSGTPFSGITVMLTGKDSQGNDVNASTTTDSTGAYSFTGLQPGTYTILAPQIPGYTTLAFGGSVSGNFSDGTVDSAGDITGIVLNQNDKGINFNFSEIFAGS